MNLLKVLITVFDFILSFINNIFGIINTRIDLISKQGQKGKTIAVIIIVLSILIAVILLIAIGSNNSPNDTQQEITDNSITSDSPTANVNPPVSNPTSDEKKYYVKERSLPDGLYTGYIDEQSGKPNGAGKMNYITGDIYDGDWSNGLPDGHGTTTYHNGDTYSGEWKDGKKSGHGVYTWNDNRMYDGYYKDDMRNGEGIYSGWTGYVSSYGWTGTYYGSNKNDSFEGYGKFVFDNGDSFKGVFKADEFWSGTYNRNGIKYTIKNGVPALDKKTA